jgi:hypothetical protein
MQSSPAPCHFLPLRSKYPPQHPVPKHPQSMYFRIVLQLKWICFEVLILSSTFPCMARSFISYIPFIWTKLAISGVIIL